MTTFNTTDQIKAYQAIVIKQALLLYAHTGLKANSAYTPAASIRAQASGWRFAKRSLSATVDAFGWSPRRGRGPPFISQFTREVVSSQHSVASRKISLVVCFTFTFFASHRLL